MENSRDHSQNKSIDNVEDEKPKPFREVHRMSNTVIFMVNNFLILIGTVLNLVANGLIFGVINMFRIRDYMKKLSNVVLFLQLGTVEVIIVAQVLMFRFVCRATGTLFGQQDNNDDLGLRDIHHLYWRGRNITYADEDKAKSKISKILTIKKSLLLRRDNQHRKDLHMREKLPSYPALDIRGTSTRDDVPTRECQQIKERDTHENYGEKFDEMQQEDTNKRPLSFQHESQNQREDDGPEKDIQREDDLQKDVEKDFSQPPTFEAEKLETEGEESEKCGNDRQDELQPKYHFPFSRRARKSHQNTEPNNSAITEEPYDSEALIPEDTKDQNSAKRKISIMTNSIFK